MPERSSYDVGLVNATRADRARIDLDEPYDVRILRLDEVRDALKVVAIA
jgi:hypothetical protein